MSATFSNTLKSQKSQLHQWKPKVSTLELKLLSISALMATNGKETFDVKTLHICYYIFFCHVLFWERSTNLLVSLLPIKLNTGDFLCVRKAYPLSLRGSVTDFFFFFFFLGGGGGDHCELPKERINFSGVVEILVSFC